MKATILSLALLLFLGACNDDDCNNTACTEDFRSVVVRVVDQSGAPVDLDRTESALEDGTLLVVNTGNPPEFENAYTVANDSHMDDLPGSNNLVTFRGWIDDVEVVNQEFVITRDCCHIGKGEGPDQIMID